MLKRVLTSVDFPRPDSPGRRGRQVSKGGTVKLVTTVLTDNHGGELEALAHALRADLVRKTCKTNVAHEGLPNNRRSRVIAALLRERGTGTVQFVCPVGRERVAIDGGNVGVRHLCKKKTKKGWTRSEKGLERGGALLLRRRGGREVG